MKFLPNNFFSRENLCRRAFFASLLATLGTWCTAAWMNAAGVLVSFPRSCSNYGTEWIISPFFKGVALAFIIFCIICNLLFWSRSIPRKYTSLWWGSIGIFTAASLLAGKLFGSEYGLIFSAFIFLWVLPLIAFYRRWSQVAESSLCWSLFLLGNLCLCRSLRQYCSFLNWQISVYSAIYFYVCLAGILLCGGALYFQGALYAGKRGVKRLFSIPSALVLAVFILSWGTLSLMAQFQENRYRESVANAEKFFGMPLNAESCEKFYCHGMKPQREYWEKFTKFSKQLQEMAEHEKLLPVIAVPRISADDKTLQQAEKVLVSSFCARALDQLVNAPLPPLERIYEKNNLECLLLDELDLLRQFALIQAWKVRLAVEKNDSETALNALKRIRFCIEYLEKDHLLISHMVIKKILTSYGDALEMMLEKDLLSPKQLVLLIDEMKAARTRLALLPRRALIGEVTAAIETWDGVYYGEMHLTPIEKILPLKWLCLLLPDLRYSFLRSCIVYLTTLQKNSFREVADAFPKDPSVHFFRQRAYNWNGFDLRYREMATKYLALETLLKLELEKLSAKGGKKSRGTGQLH